MREQFEKQWQASGYNGRKLLVAASGGIDSVVLLNLLHQAAQPAAVAHVNFQLRGAASDADEIFVKNLAAKLGFPFHTCRFETKNYATENGLSVQMAARELRYAWFDELSDRLGYDFVATAHHLNDQLETVLINFTRGTGLAGLTGIPRRQGRIIRPLLDFSREEIEEYARHEKLTWREDATNESILYDRNFVRHEIVPRLKKLNPSLEHTVARNLERLRGQAELSGIALSALKDKYVTHAGGQIRIDKRMLEDVSHPAAILFELIDEFGFNLDQCSGMVDAATGQSGKWFFSNSFQLNIDRQLLIISAKTPASESSQIGEGNRVASLGQYSLKIEPASSVQISPAAHVATLDAALLRYPLTWRRWEKGDSFMPLGMSRRKKVSDFLIDEKIPLSEKKRITVLESAGEIAWVVGHRIDNRFRVTDQTRQAAVFTLTAEHASL